MDQEFVTEHQEPRPDDQEALPVDQKWFDPSKRCPKCFKAFSSESALKYHLEQHNNKSKFLCKDCQRFILFSKKKVHVKMHIQAGEKFKCKICQKIFLNPSSLITHAKIHKEYEYPCTKCTRKFALKSNMKVHMEKIHSVKHNYPCSVCNKSFLNRLSLAHHEFRHKN